MLTYIQRAYLEHCRRMHTLRARPVKYSMFCALVDHILVCDVVCAINNYQPDF